MLNWYRLQKPIPHHPHPVSPTPINFSGYAPDITGLTVTSTVSASIQPAIPETAVPETVAHFPSPCTTYHSERIKLKRTMKSLNIDFTLLSVLSDDHAAKHVEEFIRTSGRPISNQLQRGLALQDHAVVKRHKTPIIIIIIISPYLPIDAHRFLIAAVVFMLPAFYVRI